MHFNEMPTTDQKRINELQLATSRRTGIVHGTAVGYRYYKCRCDLCRAASTESTRKFRAGLAERKMHGIPKPAPQGIIGSSPIPGTIPP